MVELLIERLRSLASPATLPAELIRRITDSAEIYHFAKGDFLLKKGQLCNGAHFIVKGVARSWFTSDNGETTTRLMGEAFIVTCWRSYYKQVPSDENITTLEECTTVYLARKVIYELYNEYDVFNTIGRKQVEYSFCLADDRTNMMRRTAAEKYKWFCENHPDLLNRVNLKYIASYLDMTIETLSRVRKAAAHSVAKSRINQLR